jgi:tetratricopeptide (TPR) repeat protein
MNLGRTLVISGNYDEADEYIGKAVALSPDVPELYDTLAFLRLELGKIAAANDDRETALVYFGQAEAAAQTSLVMDDGSHWPHINLGASLMEQHRAGRRGPAITDEAVAHYEKAAGILRPQRDELELRPALNVVMTNLCDAAIQLDQAERALQACTELIEEWPRDAVGHYNFAGALMLTGRHEEALAALERDLEFGDTEWDVLQGDSWFAPIREDPRFLRIVREMKAKAGG